MAHQQKTENPVSPSIAIELTSRDISIFIDNNLETKNFDEPINFEDQNESKIFEKYLQKLDSLKHMKYQLVTYWTVGIPDNSSQKTRKSIFQAVENFRLNLTKTPEAKLDDLDNANESYSFTTAVTKPQTKFPLLPPPTRLINRSTAGAISYLQSIRDQERAKNPNEGDIDPYLPDRHFSVIFVDGEHIYGSEFKTIDGLVQHGKSHIFKEKFSESDFKQEDESATEIQNPLGKVEELWKKVCQHKSWDDEISAVIFTYNTSSYLIVDSKIQTISQQFVISPADRFSLFPSINGRICNWQNPERFILKGINVKARMLAGDADMIDYDVPSAFIGGAIIECQDKFRASVIKDAEKLPIYRTIFEANDPISLKICFDHGIPEHERKTTLKSFVINVDENGIFTGYGNE